MMKPKLKIYSYIQNCALNLIDIFKIMIYNTKAHETKQLTGWITQSSSPQPPIMIFDKCLHKCLLMFGLAQNPCVSHANPCARPYNLNSYYIL